ncbi:MAG: hypothetical protein GY750_15945 [Lentisphaerae bacterium]|nr:hypothetical protein [Lentisphaerota bacterium]
MFLRRYNFLFIPFFQSLSSITGLVRELIFAALFGPGVLLDSFLMSFMPIDILFTFVRDFYGILIPRLPAGRRSYLNFMDKLLIIFVKFSLIPTVAYLLLPLGYILLTSNDFFFKNYFINSFIMSPLICCIFLHGFFICHFVYRGSYSWAATGMLGFNIGIALLVPVLHSLFSIYSAAIGSFAGMSTLAIFEYYFYKKDVMTMSVNMSDKCYYLSQNTSIFKDLIRPLLLLLGENLMIRSNIIFERLIGLFLGVGAISILNFSLKVTSLPINIILPILLIPVFKKSVHALESKNYKGCKKLLILSLLAGVLLIGSCCLILFVFNEQIVSILFKRGKFSYKDSLIVAKVLRYHALSLIPWACFCIINRFLWACKQNVKTFYVSIIFFLVEAIFTMILSYKFGIIGAACGALFAYSISATVSLYYIIKFFQNAEERL